MSRRLWLGVLGAVLLLSLAGCSADGSVSMTPVSDTELAEQASTELPTGDDPASIDRSVARRAVENGTATTVAQRRPVPTDRVYRYDGRFYRLSATVVGSVNGTSVGYTVNASLTEETAREEGLTVVDLGDLPQIDRTQLDPFVTSDVLDPDEGEQVGFRQTYRESELNASRLASGSVDAVRHEGELYRIRIEEREPAELQVYEYEATLVADSPAAYGRQIRSEYAFELSGLSDAEQSVVDEATGGSTYYADGNDDSGFESLVDRFRSREAITGDEYTGDYVVRYDGQLYWVEMRYGAYAEDS